VRSLLSEAEGLRSVTILAPARAFDIAKVTLGEIRR